MIGRLALAIGVVVFLGLVDTAPQGALRAGGCPTSLVIRHVDLAGAARSASRTLPNAVRCARSDWSCRPKARPMSLVTDLLNNVDRAGNTYVANAYGALAQS